MKRYFLILFFLVSCGFASAQFTYGTTGLLNMPTAEMQKDKTFMFGGGFLEKHATPARWFYNTYNYYLNITFFPWLEVAYTCTLHKALENDPFLSDGYWVPSTYGKFVNQDRSFHVRIRVWKEGWWKPWTPQIVIGGNDIGSDTWKGGAISYDYERKGNGFLNRYYIAMTKHFYWYGDWGVHSAYVYNNRKYFKLNGPCLGVNYHPYFHTHLNLMAEFDSKSVNIGMSYSIWKDHINIIGELNRCKYPSVGVFFKVHL